MPSFYFCDRTQNRAEPALQGVLQSRQEGEAPQGRMGQRLPIQSPRCLSMRLPWVLQEISMLCLHLLQISLVYINTLLIQQVLSDPEWMQKMGPNELRALTPLIYAHVNSYGIFRLVMAERLPIEAMAS